MTSISNRKPHFSRMAGGYDPQSLGDYIINMQAQLRGSGPQAQAEAIQPLPETAPARDVETKPARKGGLRVVSGTDAETPVPPSLFEDVTPDGDAAAEASRSPLDDLTTERDRLMSEISNLMSDLNSVERQRASMLGAAMADSAKR